MRNEALLNESVGAGYIDRNWPPVFRDSGAWPLTSLRQSFLDGSLTRLIDPESVLIRQIIIFIANGDFGLASGSSTDGTYNRVWFKEPIRTEEIAFESGVFLLSQEKARELTVPDPPPPPLPPLPPPQDIKTITLRLSSTIPPELWNKFNMDVIKKIKTLNNIDIQVNVSASGPNDQVEKVTQELRTILHTLELADKTRIE